MKNTRGFFFILFIAIGFGIGLYCAWMVYPIRVVNSTYHDLRQDYKTDYVLMVAESYHKDHRRFDAIIRIDRLEEESSEAAIKRAIENAEKLGYADADITMLYELNEAVSGKVSESIGTDEIYIDFNPLQRTATPTPEPEPIIEIDGDLPTISPDDLVNPFLTPDAFDNVVNDPFNTINMGGDAPEPTLSNPFDWN